MVFILGLPHPLRRTRHQFDVQVAIGGADQGQAGGALVRPLPVHGGGVAPVAVHPNYQPCSPASVERMQYSTHFFMGS